MKRINLFPLIIFSFFLFPFLNTSAADTKIIITEINYNPEGTDDGYEWFEIYNNSNDTILFKKKTFGLVDETIERDPASGKLKNTCHTILADQELEPKEFAVIVDDENKFLSAYPNFEGKVIESTVKLSNSQADIAISFDRCNTFSTQTAYEGSWGANGNGKTLEKIDFLKEDKKSNWQESFVLGGSPGDFSSVKKNYSDKILINELFPNPSENEEDEEFIEIINNDDKSADLTGWALADKSNKKFYLPNAIAEPGEYIVFYRSKFTFALNNFGDESVTLINPDGKVVDEVSYSGSVKEDYSYSRFGKIFKWTSQPTPGEENLYQESQNENASYNKGDLSEYIFISEVLPKPKENEQSDEYIEIVNTGQNTVNLKSWVIRDATKTGKYTFKEDCPLAAGDYLTLRRSQTKIALNNTKESLYLIDPEGIIISQVYWDKAPSGVSYNLDLKSNKWRWSKFLTPNKENHFDSVPKVKIVAEKKIYKNTFANFKARVRDKETKKLKISWDFGDGQKSYLKNTRHKYLRTGRFRVKLSVSDNSQTVEKQIRLRVIKYPHPKLTIVKIEPNPKGLDSLNEIIVLKNETQSKINLKDYKIASGTTQYTNHPIMTDIKIEPGKTVEISRKYSKFFLPNKSGRVAIVYPDGQRGDEVFYQKEKMKEGEYYEKVNGEWTWNVPTERNEDKIGKTENVSKLNDNAVGNTEPEIEKTEEVLGLQDKKSSQADLAERSCKIPKKSFIDIIASELIASPKKSLMSSSPLKRDLINYSLLK